MISAHQSLRGLRPWAVGHDERLQRDGHGVLGAAVIRHRMCSRGPWQSSVTLCDQMPHDPQGLLSGDGKDRWASRRRKVSRSTDTGAG